MHEAREFAAQHVVADAPFVQRARLEILDQDVGGLEQLHQHLASAIGSKVEPDRALVAVDADEVGRVLPRRNGGPQSRTSSPAGGSTLITSAPWSARICVQKGPPSTRVRSITRRPVIAPVTWAFMKTTLAGMKSARASGLWPEAAMALRAQAMPRRENDPPQKSDGPFRL